MEEIWKPIPNYEGYYEVSNTGKVKSLKRIIEDKRGVNHFVTEKELALNRYGDYYQVALSKDGKRKLFLVHRLVAIVFLPNPDNLPIVNHKDENKLNNNANNLEWCTIKYNTNYGTTKQRMSQNRKNKHIKKIWKCDYNTHERIELFDSASEAAKNIGKETIGLSAISKCARGHQKSAYGYFWEYEE